MDAKRSNVSEKYFSLGQSIAWLYGVAVGPFIVSSWLGFGPFSRPQTLHEFGDFLAGVFSPLAFLFFVISVLIQREELSLTRGEMKDSRDELKNQVHQMKFAGMAPFMQKLLEDNFAKIYNTLTVFDLMHAQMSLHQIARDPDFHKDFSEMFRRSCEIYKNSDVGLDVFFLS